MQASEKWTNYYAAHGAQKKLYPTEWVVRTLAGGKYPCLSLEKEKYPGSRILDMGCGDGRNIDLLTNLGFEVHAVEISEEMVHNLRERAREMQQDVRFSVGCNTCLSYPDGFFDYMLCCSSCYYLESEFTWSIARKELARVLRPGGLMIANFPDENNAILKNAILAEDGSHSITQDPFNIRNGARFMVPKNRDDLQSLLAPEFQVLAVGQQDDDYYGLRVSGFMTVSQCL